MDRITLGAALLSFLATKSLATPLQYRAGNITCPQTPTPWPKPDDFPKMSTMPDPFLYLDQKTRVQTKDECGNALTVKVDAGEKSTSIKAQINLPSGTSTGGVPVVIVIGGIDNKAYTGAGIAVVTFDYSSVAADSNSKTGSFWDLYKGQDIGVLTAWAWGFHRVLDGITDKVPEIDHTKVGVTGCSRLDKAALAAGLFDTRITVTMPMSSGVQGLGPYRYHALSGQDETLENSKSGAGWWTNSILGTFVGKSEQLPYDAHAIAMAIAPRALIIDQGTGDQFTNSKGTAVVVYPPAKLVYKWLGVSDQIGMAVRSGAHCDMSGYTNVLPFVAKVLKGTPTTRNYDDILPYTAMPTAYPWSTSIPQA